MTHAPRALTGLAVALVSLVACAPLSAPPASPTATVLATLGTPSPTATEGVATTAPRTPTPSPAPTLASPSPAPTVAAPTPTPCVALVLGGMSLEQRVGQLFMVGLPNDHLGAAEIAAIESAHLGSVWLTGNTAAGARAIAVETQAVQALTSPANTANVKFLIGVNQEGGLIQQLKGPGFSTVPSAMAQSELAPDVLRARAAAWGRELVAAGVNLNFAPVLDVVPPGTDEMNEPIGSLGRGYGNDPVTVAVHGLAFLEGMQDAGVVTTAKHFPGLGRVVGNTDFTAEVIDSVTTIDDPYLTPFIDAIHADVPFIMIALASYQNIDAGRIAAFSPIVLRDLLRTRLHFNGVIMSDDLGATVAVALIPPGDRAVMFIAAGGDIIVTSTGTARAMAAALVERARSDESFRTRVDDAARRVLAAKLRSGLLPCA